jgi:hypothetical protein
MKNKFDILFDIVEYNAYIVEFSSKNIQEANKTIFSLSKRSSQNTRYKFLHGKIATYSHGELFTNISFNSVKFKNDNNEYRNIDVKKIDDNKDYLFCYNLNVAEYNRYSVSVFGNTKEEAINIVNNNKNLVSFNYNPALIQINTRSFFKNLNILMILN